MLQLKGTTFEDLRLTVKYYNSGLEYRMSEAYNNCMFKLKGWQPHYLKELWSPYERDILSVYIKRICAFS